MRYWTDFFREFRRQFHTTGAVLPSSRFLGRALASGLRGPRGPGRFLEVGPGTGAVTAEVLRQLQPDDRLDIVEINAAFVEVLRRRFDGEWAAHRPQVHLMHAPVEEVQGEAVYDVIVSGLPLNNFAVDDVRRIFGVFERLLKPGGTLSYFEYLAVRTLKAPFVGRAGRERLAGIGRLTGEYIRRHQVRADHVYWNVPPAVARHLSFK